MSQISAEHIANLIDTVNLQRYLRHSGWNQHQDKRGLVTVFRRDGAEITLPLVRETFADYAENLVNAIEKVASLEHSDIADVIDRLTSPATDVLEFRVADTSTDTGKIGLYWGLSLLNGASKAITATACSVVKPQKFHPRMHRSEVDAFMSACELGQSHRGSFIAHVVCPIAALPFEDPQLRIFDNEDTFGRKVTTLFIQSLYALVMGIENGTAEDLTQGENPLLSSNFCQALLTMQPEASKSSLVIGSKWDRATKPPALVPSKVVLRPEYFPAIEQVAVALRNQSQQLKSSPFLGLVEELKGEPGKDGRMEGEVILRILTPDEEQIKARLVLNSDHYQIACDAHRDNRAIGVRAELHRRPRLSDLKNYTTFAILEYEDVS